jgi:predicted nucleic acid-binding protein
MRVVVADATPLNYLILVDAVEILPKLFTKIHLPAEVANELRSADAPEAVKSWMTRPPSWMEVSKSDETASTDASLDFLDLGERAAILLAESIHADLLLIDEREGTRIAEHRGLTVAGTLGVLDLADRQGLVDLRAVFARLQRTNFRYPPSLMEKLLTESERRNK